MSWLKYSHTKGMIYKLLDLQSVDETGYFGVKLTHYIGELGELL